jgi:cell division transport system permease protein
MSHPLQPTPPLQPNPPLQPLRTLPLPEPVPPRKDESPAKGNDPLPSTLKQNQPLVPVDSAASRALVAVIAILTFLAALCGGAAEIVASHSAQWRSDVAREVTIQVRPQAGRDIEADVTRAAALSAQIAGIHHVHNVTKAESQRLLEPWLGVGLDLSSLPVPRLIVLQIEAGTQPNFALLRANLLREVPNAALDDHRLWLSRLSTMANTLIGIGVMLVLLVLIAAGLAVTFATRGAMAGNREIVEVLHFVGADDRFIAQEYQSRFARMGLRGGIAGGIAAFILILLFRWLAASWQESAAGDQVQALFGSFEIGWRGVFIVFAIAGIVSLIAGIVSRLTVRRFLQDAV